MIGPARLVTCIGILALLWAPRLGAQTIPGLQGVTPEQALTLLQQNPQLQEQLRQRILGSGVSQLEIQQRLVDAGYPPDLLDTYLFDPTAFISSLDLRMLKAISLLGVNADRTAGATVAAPRLPEPALVAPDTTHLATGLPLFGLDVFRRPTTAFSAPVSGPVDGSYVLGPGDVMVLILTGAVQTANVLEVTREGFVVIDRVGQLFVNTLTLDQFRELLYGRLSRVYSGISRGRNPKTKFEITVARVRSDIVRVIGEVQRPGSYAVAATGGVLNALYQAGSIKPSGSFRTIEVRRGSELVGTVDLYDYLLRGVVPTGLRLHGGDVVFVPIHGAEVKIAGEVERPAIYELKPGETIRDALRFAGGLTPYASSEGATIDRVLPPEQRPEPGHNRTVLTVNLAGASDSSDPPVALLAADSITVASIRGGRRGAVTVNGSVWQPGTYAMTAGMRLNDAIQVAGGLRPETYSGRVQVLRTRPDSTRLLMGVPLSSGGVDPANNPPMQEGDQVTVFAMTDFRPDRYVTVNGVVNKPGRVAYADSMTLRDAILLAGGPAVGAYLGQAEVSRLNPSEGASGDSVALILRVQLDSSYLADGSGGRQAGAPAVLLEPYDQIFVRARPGWELQRNVTLTGEVRFPGGYTLTDKRERLLSVIQRAGGLTPDAYPNGIQFFRATASAGRLGVDLDRTLRDPQYRDNLVLEAGDSINIPRYNPVVRVEGAVEAPTSVTYRPGADLRYYVDAAGGYLDRADKGRTYVLQPNGQVEKRGQPQPGAVVHVPQREATQRGSTLVLVLSALAPLVASLTTIVAVIKP